MRKWIHYDVTYSPVTAWSTICLVLALVSVFNWHTIKIDYAQAYSQAPVERELYMEIPKGYNIQGNKATNEYA